MNKSFFSLSLITSLVFFQACTTQDEVISTNQDASIDALALSQPIFDFPEKVPSDAIPFSLALEENTSWHDYHNYYNLDLLAKANEPFYENLQWITIANLIRENDFEETANKEIRLFYLDEMTKRNFINEPEVASILLHQLSTEISSEMLAKHARRITQINESHFSTKENFIKHKSRHESAYVQLYAMGYDRWGNKL